MPSSNLWYTVKFWTVIIFAVMGHHHQYHPFRAGMRLYLPERNPRGSMALQYGVEESRV